MVYEVKPGDFAVLSNTNLMHMLRGQPELGYKFLMLLLRLGTERMLPAMVSGLGQFVPKSV